MRILWFAVFAGLVGALFATVAQWGPTGMVVGNRPPEWDFPTAQFELDPGDGFRLDLNDAFFDPDGDQLLFSSNADLIGTLLVISPRRSTEVWIEASDGQLKTAQRIVLEVR